MGEPLLDRELPEKIRIAKEHKLKGIGFSSNCTNLDSDMGRRLLESGLDTLVCSLPSLQPDTYMKIMNNHKFDTVVQNIKNFIEMRNKQNANTRVFFRFVAQDENTGQYENYKRVLNKIIDRSRGDNIIKNDLHNWGGKVETALEKKKHSCYMIANNFLHVDAYGMMLLCCMDFNNSVKLGNVFEQNIIELFNSPEYNKIRHYEKLKQLHHIPVCRNCVNEESRENARMPK